MNAATFALICAAVLLGVYVAAWLWRTLKMGGWHGNRCLVCRTGTMRPHRFDDRRAPGPVGGRRR
jgi:hypothetical protein